MALTMAGLGPHRHRTNRKMNAAMLQEGKSLKKYSGERKKKQVNSYRKLQKSNDQIPVRPNSNIGHS
jgi:hypothetical protein